MHIFLWNKDIFKSSSKAHMNRNVGNVETQLMPRLCSVAKLSTVQLVCRSVISRWSVWRNIHKDQRRQASRLVYHLFVRCITHRL